MNNLESKESGCVTRALKAGAIILAVYGLCTGTVLGIHELIKNEGRPHPSANKVPTVKKIAPLIGSKTREENPSTTP
jgi:hypothetical protein